MNSVQIICRCNKRHKWIQNNRNKNQQCNNNNYNRCNNNNSHKSKNNRNLKEIRKKCREWFKWKWINIKLIKTINYKVFKIDKTNTFSNSNRWLWIFKRLMNKYSNNNN